MRYISGPADVRGLAPQELPALADELRQVLVGTVCRTGGHLGSNLGVVELTIALHRVFDSPCDRILWDTGHQAYVHKLLTGRRHDFGTLRQAGGISGYPARTSPSTTSWRIRTRRRHCPMRTDSPKPPHCEARPDGRSLRSSGTVR